MNDVALHSEPCDAAADPACPRCGSTPRPPRLTLRWLLRRARADVLGLERGLLPTLWHLLVAPERVTTAYLSEGAPRYYGPFKLLLIVTALSLLAMPAATLVDGGFARVVSVQLAIEETRALAFVQDWNALIYLPFVVLLAGATRGFFRARRLNYAEHLVLMLYGWSQMMLISTLVMLCVAGLKAVGIRGPALALLLLLAPAWWFWYVARVLRLRQAADWLRALVVLPAAFVTFVLLTLMLLTAITPWLKG